MGGEAWGFVKATISWSSALIDSCVSSAGGSGGSKGACLMSGDFGRGGGTFGPVFDPALDLLGGGTGDLGGVL